MCDMNNEVNTLAQSFYYNPNKMLSYNRLLNFVIGARGIGKSYSMKKYPINRFLKNGEQFVYVRRYKEELKKLSQYFTDIEHEFPEHNFKVKGRQLFCDDKLMGFAIPLSQWQKEKSNAYPNVTTIIFDEFIKQKDTSRYLPNEVEALLNLIDTIIRDRDNARVVCLSNAVTITNPYFLYFKITPDLNKRYNAYKNSQILVEIPDSKDFAEHRRETKFGQLINNTNYGDMALNNEFTEDSSVFVEQRSKQSKYKFSVVYKGVVYGIWLDVPNGIMYMTNKHDPDSKRVFTLSINDLDGNNIYMKNYKSNYYLKNMVDFFKVGAMRFDNQNIKNIAFDMFNDMGVQ